MDKNIVFGVSRDGSLIRFSAFKGKDRKEYPFYRHGPWKTHFQMMIPDNSIHDLNLNPTRDPKCFAANECGFNISLSYKKQPAVLCLEIRAKNLRKRITRCSLLRLVMGFDTFMYRFPDFMGKLFPTTLHYEPTHFWGLLGSPDGKWLGVISPDALDSYKIFYNTDEGCYKNGFKDGAHQIDTIGLDLINDLDPRPMRYAPSKPVFQPGETRTWRIYLAPLVAEEELGPSVARYAQAPFLVWKQSGGRPNEKIECEVFTPGLSEPQWSFYPTAELAFHKGGTEVFDQISRHRYEITLPDSTPTYGRVVSFFLHANGRRIEPFFYVLNRWDRYVYAASAFAATQRPPVATLVCEAYMPLLSLIVAQYLSPSPTRKARIEGFLRDELFQAAFDADGKDLMHPDRIENLTRVVDLCRETYLATRDLYWLGQAEKVASQFLKHQGRDGGFYGHGGKAHYSCVFYPVKSLIDLMDVEKAASKNAKENAPRRKRMIRALRKAVVQAMEDLYRRGPNVGTEGSPTYEDGMISCSALQLALWSIKTGQTRFARRAEEIMAGHRCLEWRGPDVRTNGATLRFWESFWALGWHNCLNTPHAWSAWTGYAWYYLYLATGTIAYFYRFLNNLMACLYLIDTRSGEVFFCYTPEPTVYDNASRAVAGERLLQPVPPSVQAETGGGETHEIVKFIRETVLENGFIFHENGRWKGLNVILTKENGKVCVLPETKLIKKLFVNRGGNSPTDELNLAAWNKTDVSWHG